MLNPFDDPNNPHYWIDEKGVRHIAQPEIPSEEIVVHNVDGEVCAACLARDGVERIHEPPAPAE